MPIANYVHRTPPQTPIKGFACKAHARNLNITYLKSIPETKWVAQRKYMEQDHTVEQPHNQGKMLLIETRLKKESKVSSQFLRVPTN